MNNNSYALLLNNANLFEKIILCASELLNNSTDVALSKALSKATRKDFLLLTSQVPSALAENASKAAGKLYGGNPLLAPSYIFSPQEIAMFEVVLKQSNSKYKYEVISVDNESHANLMMAEAMHVIGMYNAYMEPDGHLDLLQSVRFAVDVLPNEIEQEGDSEIFNFCIYMIQKSIGQPFGDNAALFFSGDEFYESWGGLDRDGRFNALMEYCKYEIDNSVRV